MASTTDKKQTAEETPNLSWYQRLFVPEVIRGLAVSGRHFIRNLFGGRDDSTDFAYRKGSLGNQVATLQYPEEKVSYPEGYRGTHRLVPREDGKPRCVACYMCATVCPAQCIYIEAGEYEDDPVEKFPTSFVIDQLRCVVCGLCVEACPKDAIRMDTYQHTPPEYTREGFVYPIERLLKGPAVSHPSDPWVKRPSSEQPKDQHFPLHGVAEHSTKPVERKEPLPQGKEHPEPPDFTEAEVRKANAG